MSCTSRCAEAALLVFVHATASSVASSVATAQTRTESETHVLRRMEYFESQRSYPFDRIPPGALQRARTQLEARFGLSARLSMGAIGDPTNNAWTPLGPGTINNTSAAGRVTAIAIHPTVPSTIYAGGAQGGIWKTVDGGGSWTPLTDAQCSLAVGSIAIDPISPNIVYAGTGEQNNSSDSYYGCGILRSTDGGASWTQFGADVFVTATGGGARIGHLVVDRQTAGSPNSTVLLASTSFGLFRSTNSGQSWTRMFLGNVSGLAADVANRVYYAAVGNYGTSATQNTIYKSTDAGANWAPLSLGIATGTTLGRIELAVAPSNPSIIYAAIEDRTPGSTSSQLLGVWRSLDAGATWVKAATAGATCASQCWYDMTIAVDPLTPTRVYFGGLSFYLSEDSGETFSNIGRTIHVDHHTIVFDPTDPAVLYAGSDGGVYRTANRGLNWTSLNTNLAITQFYHGVSLHPTDTAVVLGGTQDNGTLLYSGAPSWASVVGGDGGFTAINPSDPTTAFATLEWITGSNSNGPRRRDALGQTFRQKNIGITLSDGALFIPPLVMDLSNPATLYFGTFRLYRTTDNGETWTPISNNLTKTGSGSISSIAPAPTDARTVYVGLNDGNVQVTVDSGATWTQVIAGLPSRVVTEIVVDPLDARIAYLTVSGFGTGHVFRTDNAGQSWANVSGDLINVPVTSLALIPRSNDLYIGTDLGVFRSTNGGKNWVPFMEGFPNVAVFSLVFNDRTRHLVAATHGRGMFRLALPALVLRGDVDGDGKITALDAQLALMGAVGLPLPDGKSAYPGGDANCDGVTNALDAQIILSHVVGQATSQFCVGTIR